MSHLEISSSKSDEADDNFNLLDLSTTLTEIEQENCKLPFKNLEDVANYLKVKKPKNVVFLVGAGISTAAGIPDFRSPNTEDVFDLGFFRKNPNPFFELAKSMFLIDVRPTFTHYFMKMFVNKGFVRRIYSQNIDTLEFQTGIDDNIIVTAHGSHRTNTCMKCRAKYTQAYIEEHLQNSVELVPKCSKCKGVIKPDIVFFGENLPERFYDLYSEDFRCADVLFIMGTSLTVYPVCGLVQNVKNDIPRILFNLEPSGQNMLSYHAPTNKRDYFHQGATDETCRKLAELLGWLPEIEAMMQPEKKIEDNTKTDSKLVKSV